MAAAPNDAEVANFVGDTLRLAGELDEALAMERRAAELDPLFTVNPSDLGWALLMRHRAREAFEQGARSLQLDPRYWSAMDMRARALLRLGDLDAAQAEVDRFAALKPDLANVEELRARLAIARGDPAAARPFVAALQRRAAVGETVNYVLAMVLAGLGDHAATAHALEAAFAARDPMFTGDVEMVQPDDWPDDPAVRAVFARPELAPMIAARARFAGDRAR